MRRTQLWLATLWLVAHWAVAAEYVWIEGEKPTSTNLKPNIAGWGRKHFLSEETWLHVSIDAGKVDKELPAEGGALVYSFQIVSTAPHEVWNRIGFEFVRSPFDWRIDDGDWTRVMPDQLTTDCMELDFWCEVAWLKLGEQRLSAGEHRIEIRLPKTQDDKGKTARILYASDAICLAPKPFVPHSRHKPDQPGHGADYEEAAVKTFAVPAPGSPHARVSVPLEGLWEICRHDEQLPGPVAEPIRELPATPRWTAIRVPGNKNALRPDLELAHRLWYRTRVRVPDSCSGRSFHIVFPQNNLNTTVYVNGTYCGFNKDPFARFAIEVTEAVKPGVNEVWVGIRDAYYGYSANPDDPMKLRRTFNYPLSVTERGFQHLAYPVWHHFQSGILVTPEFVVAGRAYASDVFCKPSVTRRELGLEVTVSNPVERPVSGDVLCEAVNDRTGAVEKTFAPRSFSVAPAAEHVLSFAEPWAEPDLWWPDEPDLYRLRVTVRIDGTAVDLSETTFGFREWTWDGRFFKLNGVRWQLWADCFTAGDPDSWLRFYRANNERMMRFWGTSWMGMPPEEALDWFDRNGVIVRRSGILDGEAIGYMAIEQDPVLKELYGSPIKMDLMENWRDQMIAQVKGERNHPSVMIWSIENEWLYINCINLYGGLMDQFEAAVKDVSDAVMAVDPTRPTMNDGGGAHKNNAMPVHGDHYVAGAYWKYPALAYDANTKGGGRRRWEWDEQRPRFIGEDFYITGNNPQLSYFGGEEAFQGKAATRPAASTVARILTEGYRWSGQSAWHFWMGQNDAPGQYLSYAPRAVFCRQWDWTFASGARVTRTLRVFNDTRHGDPMMFSWALHMGDRRVAGEETELRLAPGSDRLLELGLPMPKVRRRTEGEWRLALSVRGKEVFQDTKAVSVLPSVRPGSRLAARDLLVLDPGGEVAAFLTKEKVRFTPVASLAELPTEGKVVVVGRNALDTLTCTSSQLAACAADGRRVVVLEQTHPLRYQGLPADMPSDVNQGTTAFAEDLGHPVLQGLAQKDFFTWGEDEAVYRNAYKKPTRGARSLIQCHDSLQNSALAEAPVGEGLMLVCQLALGEKLGDCVVARHLLCNLIDYAAEYRLEYRPVTACLAEDAQFRQALHAVGVLHEEADVPLKALRGTGPRIAVVSATPEALGALAERLDRVSDFVRDGGWIVFQGLTPEGLGDFNRIVGVDHMIRPARRERVGFPSVRSPLMNGLSLSDVVLYSSERIFPWTQGNYVAHDMFTHVLDYEDVAPFAEFGDYNYEHPDWNASNMVNGMVSADAWKYIVNVPAPENGPVEWDLRLPKAQTVREVAWIGNTFYYPATRFELVFDGDEVGKAAFTTEPNNEPQVFQVDPPRTGRAITLRLTGWVRLPGKAAVTGLDNIRLLAERPPEFYHSVRPMLSTGGMMEYPRGKGGFVLSNLLFRENEDVPLNATRKRTILATVLRNLKAPFAGGKTLVAGARMAYAPVDLRAQANQYLDERGWFGDRTRTFKDLPKGEHTFGGVPFVVYDFPTSPVPTVLMLGGNGVPNSPPQEVKDIPVERRADVLFFLHTARLDARRSQDEVKKGVTYEALRYVVTYSDGTTEAVPVHAEIDIHDYRQRQPAGLPGAQLGWTRPYEGTEEHASVYVKQWNNPRPDVAITSIDMVYGEHRRGVPALIALTTAVKED